MSQLSKLHKVVKFTVYQQFNHSKQRYMIGSRWYIKDYTNPVGYYPNRKFIKETIFNWSYKKEET